MRLNKILLIIALILIAISISMCIVGQASGAPIPPMELPGSLLLVNPSLEGNYHIQNGVSEVNVPDGWMAWYYDNPPCRPLKPGCDLPCPDNCLKESTSVLSGTDGLITLSPVTLTIGHAVRLTVTLVTTKPLQAADLYLLINPVVYTVSEISLLDGYATMRWARGIVRYDREVPTGTVGNVPLFALTLMPVLTDSVHVEIVYWLWSDTGGMYETAWAGVASQPHRLSARVSAGAPACVADTGCYWARPEFVPTDRPERVHSGEKAQKYFTVGRMHDAGISQTVSVTPGDWYDFSFYAQTWQCYDFVACCHKRPTCISDQPAYIGIRAGIAVTPGTILWSAPVQAFDSWKHVSMFAQAITDTITVYAGSSARFDYARQNNDVYIDDASLVKVRVVFGPLMMIGKE